MCVCVGLKRSVVFAGSGGRLGVVGGGHVAGRGARVALRRARSAVARGGALLAWRSGVLRRRVRAGCARGRQGRRPMCLEGAALLKVKQNQCNQRLPWARVLHTLFIACLPYRLRGVRACRPWKVLDGVRRANAERQLGAYDAVLPPPREPSLTPSPFPRPR